MAALPSRSTSQKTLKWLDSDYYTDLYCTKCDRLHLNSSPIGRAFGIGFQCHTNIEYDVLLRDVEYKTYGEIMDDFEKLFKSIGYTIAPRNIINNKLAIRTIEYVE